MQTYSQVSGQHFQTPPLMMGNLSHPMKGLAPRQMPWHKADDVNLRREILSLIMRVLQRHGLEKMFDIAKDMEMALYSDATSKEDYGDFSTLEHRIRSFISWLTKNQNSAQSAQLAYTSSKTSYFHGNTRDALAPGPNMVNASTPFSQVQSGVPGMNLGSQLALPVAQTPLGAYGSGSSRGQSKLISGFQNGGSWMIPTPGLNISNSVEMAVNDPLSDVSSDLFCTIGPDLHQLTGKVTTTNDSSRKKYQLGSMAVLSGIHNVGQEHGFVKDSFVFSSPIRMQTHPTGLQQQPCGDTPSDGYATCTNILVKNNPNNPTLSTGVTTCPSSSVSLAQENSKLDMHSQHQDLKPPKTFVSVCSYRDGVSAENPIFPVQPGVNWNQPSPVASIPHTVSFGSLQEQHQLRKDLLQKPSQNFEGNSNIEIMEGCTEKKVDLCCKQQKLCSCHDHALEVVEHNENICQASSADTGQSEVVSNDEAPSQIKGVANLFPSQQVKKHQWLLIFLRHVSRCTDSSHCNVVNCAVGREVWKHLITCHNYPCSYPRCMMLKSLLGHHQKCRLSKCKVCGPVRTYFSHQAAAVRSKMHKSKQAMNTVIEFASHEVDSSPSLKKMKVEVLNPNTDLATEQPKLTNAKDNQDGSKCHITPSPPKLAEYECKVLTAVGETLEKEVGLTSQKVESPIDSSVSEGSQVNKICTLKNMRSESNQISKDATVLVASSLSMRLSVKNNKQTSVISTHVPLKGSSDSAKPLKAKISGISYIENFCPEQIRQHIASLRKWTGKSRFKVEKNQALQHQMSTSACSACAVEDLYFDPIPNFCTQCGCRIKRNATYYNTGAGENSLSFCGPCYNAIRSDTVETYGSKFQKSTLIKKKNDEQRAEGWVECDKCKKWQHQVCVLFNARMNKERSEYVCPECCIREMERAERMPRPANSIPGAKDLPRTILSDYIQQRLALKLKQERLERAKAFGKNVEEVPAAEGLVVRVLSSIDKKLEVKPKFLELFQEGNYPKDFSYKSKMLMLFQDIEGVEVCLFGMYVQEFGAESPQPNHRWVYLSYLDSVKYFRPDVKTVRGEALRTYVYHEILIGYLDYCKKRGFSSCYIWACPPLKGDDYILYCHPEIQKTPKTDKLREWYLSMISKAKTEKIVVSNKNLYDYFFTVTGDCKAKVTATRLPYFDGDYWPGAAEDLLHQLQQDDGSHQPQRKGKTKKLTPKRTTKTSAHAELGGNISMDMQLMHKLGQSIVAMKEDFMIVHLHHACSRCRNFIYSGLRWVCQQCAGNFQLCSSCHEEHQRLEDEDKHPAGKKEWHCLSMEEVNDIPVDSMDKDEIMESEFFDIRQAFLSLCQGNQYQFDTLRRAKHSSMMVLYHIHNPNAPAFITSCTICHSELEEGQGYKCKICTDFDICHSCHHSSQEVRKHPHKFVARSSATDPSADDRKQRVLQVRMMLEVLVHASKCNEASCQYAKCRNIKDLFRHGLSCTKRVAGGCAFCKRMWFLLTAHARGCKETDCNVPRCMDIRKHLKRTQLQQESRRRAAVNEMIRQRAAEAAGVQ